MKRVRVLTGLSLLSPLLLAPSPGRAQTTAPRQSSCRIEPTTFRAWHAQQLVNEWVTLTIVPQLGGRLMQVAFAVRVSLHLVDPHGSDRGSLGETRVTPQQGGR